MANSARKVIRKSLKKSWRKIQVFFTRIFDVLIFTCAWVERFAVWLVVRVYEGRYRADWIYSKIKPHFFNQRIGLARLFFSKAVLAPYGLNRGFFSAQVIRHNDRLLDIGCGDGFFTRRFFAERCVHVDGIDIEPSAIEAARRYNSAPNVYYYLLDAVAQPFPQSVYDVIVWDGALGHFASETLEVMLQKITNALTEGGIFTGSESLGSEGHDHLQYFGSLEDVGELLARSFKYVDLYSTKYMLPGGHLREEAYWRCTNTLERLDGSSWKRYNRGHDVNRND